MKSPDDKKQLEPSEIGSAPLHQDDEFRHDAPSGIELDVPPYPELKTIFLGGIFLLILLTIFHLASDLVIPVVLAFVLKLVLQPAERFLERFYIPRFLSALIIVLMVMGSLFALISFLSAPATLWVEKVSASFPSLQERLSFLSTRVASAQKMMVNAENMTQGSGTKIMAVAVEGTRLSDRVFLGTRAFISSLFTTVLLLLFLLASGDTFLRRIVEILPRFKDKRQAVDISQHIERDISMYLLTITFMNALVGILTGIAMAACGREDAILWGAFAFLLNYVPIIGPLIGFAIFTLVGFLLDNKMGTAILPAMLYLGIHLCESNFVTPMLLAKRFTINPVLVILSLIFWYWMWGFAGAVLAMPMLAITKKICDRIDGLKPLGHFLEGG